MSWGILFRREINLTYARIQDIHLRSNVVERWLDLARVEVQTASGSSTAEMTLEGLLEFEAIRDYLYTRMRGARDQDSTPQPQTSEASEGTPGELAILREVAAGLKALRHAVGGADRGGIDA
jgi:putative membrane protein